MPYRRRSYPFSSSSLYDTKTKVSIYWSINSSAYAIKFSDTKHWDKMQILLQYIKNFPMGERDYDKENKIWYLIEPHIPAFKDMIVMLNEFFDLDYQEKQTNNTRAIQTVPMSVYLDKFMSLTGESVKDIDIITAKKIYRKWMIKNHPDVGGNKDRASEVNECWSNLEVGYFKSRKEVEYQNV